MVNVLSKLEVNLIFLFHNPLPPQTNISEHMLILIFFIRVYVKNSFFKFVQAL